MKIGLDRDERWPCYCVCDLYMGPMRTVEVDRATLRRWRRVIRAYEAVQREMAAVWKEDEE